MRTRKQILRDSLPLKDAIVTAPQVYLELILEVLLDIREHATLGSVETIGYGIVGEISGTRRVVASHDRGRSR